MARDKKIILFFLIPFLLSLTYSFYFKVQPTVDARAYDNIGWNIAQGNGYRESLEGPANNDLSIFRVGPAYEIFLGVVYYVFGHNYYVVWFFQALFHALTAYFVFLITKEVFKKSWTPALGLISASLVAFSPDLITISSMLLTENLAVLTVTIAAYLFFKYKNHNSLKNLLIFTFSFWLSVMSRTPVMLIILPIGAYFIINKKWKDLFIILATLLVLFTPWTIRNYRIYGEVLPTNVSAGFNLYNGNYPGASGEQESNPKLYEYTEKYGFLKADKIAFSEAMGFILNDPWAFIKRTIYRISVYFSFSRPMAFWFHLHGFSKLATIITSSIHAMILFIAGVWGIVGLRGLPNEDKKRAKFLLGILVMMPLSIIGIVVETRYRLPVYPFLAVFGGWGLILLFSRKLKLLPILMVTSLLLINTLVDISTNIGRVIERLHSI